MWLWIVEIVSCFAEETATEEWPFFLFSQIPSSKGPSHLIGTHHPIGNQLHNAYFTGQKMPPGCDCRKIGETDRECTHFDCSCICDLTAGVLSVDRHSSLCALTILDD